MRSKFFVFFFCAMMSISSSGYAQDAMSVWDTAAITIDGKCHEWPSFFRFYISGAKLQFDFYNDSTNLYLCVKAVDMEAQARLMHAGLDLWFDPTGKKKQKTGIAFPLKLEGAPGEVHHHYKNSDPSAEPSEKSQTARLKERVLFAQASIKVTGMIDVKEPEILLQNKYGIEVAYDWDSLNILAIEYKIPLSLIYQHQILPGDLEHPMGLGIVVGALETPHNTSSPGGQGSQHGGMGGGMNGGGMNGSRGGSRGSSSQNNLANDRFNGDNAEQKVWLKVHWQTQPPTKF